MRWLLSKSAVRCLFPSLALDRPSNVGIRFQKREYAPIDIVQTEKKGFGVRARQDMPASVFPIRSVTVVLTCATLK
jgi:hypothetical protein